MPYLGVFVYLVVRGDKMAQHAAADALAQDDAARAYIRDAAGSASSPVDELERLAALRSKGMIDDTEFARLKAKVVG
jgi:hypothetical protein